MQFSKLAGLLGPLVALAFVLVSAALSPWFSFWSNALSDLGHAVRSGVAVLFNFGLAVGGLMVLAYGVSISAVSPRILQASIVIMGAQMNLVGVFDEVYGGVHFWFSVAFFFSLALFLIAYAISFKAIGPLVSLAFGACFWIAHFAYGVPPGVAVPELASVLLALPWYYALLARIERSSAEAFKLKLL